MDDECAEAICSCNQEGPLIFPKWYQPLIKDVFCTFGRVFAGTVQTGQKVHIMGPSYGKKPGKKSDLFVKNIQRTVLMMG